MAPVLIELVKVRYWLSHFSVELVQACCLGDLTPTQLNFGVCVYESLSCIRLFVTPWAVAHQAPLSLGFSRQEYWSGLPFPSPRDLPDTGITPGFPELQVDSLPSEPPVKLWGLKTLITSPEITDMRLLMDL